jgi:CheY-like chemotaxis protein
MKFDEMGLAFPQECLRAALLVSLLSVWVLVGLFHYLNRYTRRQYFSIWTGAWLFYALWLTLGFCTGNTAPGGILFTINQVCVSISAVLLLWGSMRFLGFPFPQKLSGLCAAILAVWILASSQMTKNSLQIHLPEFVLLGLSSPFAGVCFLRLKKQKAFMGLGLLSLGFLLWVIYIGSYPFPREHGVLYSAGFFVAAVLQLFIAASMIVLLFREVRRDAQLVREEMEAVRLEKEALMFKVVSTKEACQTLYNRMRASGETEKAVVEREHLEAIGRMTGNMAHDINNALSPITAYSELLLNTLPDLPEVPRLRLQRIKLAAENVARIVAQMRESHRTGPNPDPSCDMNINPAGDRALEPKPGERCRPLCILCIDDEPQLRELLYDVLETEHHQVTVATGGKEGLDIFRSMSAAGEPYEAVVTDLSMPEIDGRHVARAIKAESPQTPVIMLTGWGTMMEADGQTAPEVDAVLSKPPRVQELSNLLFQVTERSAT